MAGGAMAAVEVEALRKTFGNGRKALEDVSLRIPKGEMVALIGASGSGKSTLLRHLSGLVLGDRNGGAVRVLGETVQEDGRLSREINRIRGRIGFIFQQFNLVDRLPVLTNVLAGRIARTPLWRTVLRHFTRSEKVLARQALDRVGIGEHADQRAGTLSGGQQQRAAIARALVQQAEVILADEPIASLDPESSRCIMDLLASINRTDGTTILVSLHQVEYALGYCPAVIALKDGRVVFNGKSSQLTREMLQDVYRCGDGSDAGSRWGDDDCRPELTGSKSRWLPWSGGIELCPITQAETDPSPIAHRWLGK